MADAARPTAGRSARERAGRSRGVGGCGKGGDSGRLLRRSPAEVDGGYLKLGGMWVGNREEKGQARRHSTRAVSHARLWRQQEPGEPSEQWAIAPTCSDGWRFIKLATVVAHALLVSGACSPEHVPVPDVQSRRVSYTYTALLEQSS
jgi:hypothetical protein